MSKGFLYFLPGCPATGDAARAFGVPALSQADKDQGEGVGVRGVPGGFRPAGEAGQGTLAHVETGKGLHDLAAMRWQKIDQSLSGIGKPFWIGWEEAAPPKPQDLARRTLFAGQLLKLGDEAWQVPVAKLLPRVFGVDPEGHLSQVVAERYREVHDEAWRWCQLRLGLLDGGEIGDAELFRLAARILGLNYRVGVAEIAALGLLDGYTLQRVLDVYADWETVLAFVKKKPAGSDTSEAPPSSNG